VDLGDQLGSTVLDDLEGTSMADATAAKGHYIRFVGWLREDGVFTLDPGWETPKITESPRPNGDYSLELLDGQRQVLIAVTPHVDSDVCQPLGGRMKSLRVLAYLPWRSNGAAVRFRRGDRIVDERPVEPAPPEVAWETARVSEGTLHLQWRARHSARLTYAVGIVQGTRGVKMLERLSATEAAIPVESIPLQGECQAAVLATDSLRSATAHSGTFVLPAKAPTIVVLRPGTGEVFSEIEGVPLVGHAMTPDGSSLPDEGLRWSVDGVTIARGYRVAWAGNLSVGSHTVELSLEGERAVTNRVVVTIRAMSPEEAEWARRFAECRAAANGQAHR
jgi:hypothetical protein